MQSSPPTPFDDPQLSVFHGGFIPTPQDPRQRLFMPRASRSRVAAARVNHDLRILNGQGRLMPIGNQKQIGSCAAMTFGYELRGSLAATYHIMSGTKADLNDTLSPRFVYDIGRGPEFMNTYPEDSGMDMRTPAAVLLKYGVPPEHDMPYQNSANNGPIAAEFTEHVKEAAAFYGISGYYQCQGTGAALIDSILLALDSGSPVGLAILIPGTMKNGVAVSSSFEQVGGDGRIPLPYPGEVPIGGHAISVWANFIDNSFPGGGAFLCQNHWTRTWGAVNNPDTAGMFYLPFGYFTASSGQYGYWGQEGWVIV